MKNFFLKQKKIFYKKNQIILQCEDLPQGVYYLHKGVVRVYAIGENGNELTFNIFIPGSFFPMYWAVNNSINNYYFEAMSNVTVYRAQQSDFQEYIKRDSERVRQINEMVLHSLSSTLNRMQYLVLGTAEQKVACVLIMLARRFSVIRTDGCFAIMHPITQQQIAQLSALTRESVSTILGKFQGEKMIRKTRTSYLINDYPRLLATASYYVEAKTLPYIY